MWSPLALEAVVAGIVLNLLGTPTVTLPHGSPAQDVKATKCLALLAYLTLEPGPHSREELATLLWGESPEEAARASLRQALKRLRGACGEALQMDRHNVCLTSPLDCDVPAFLKAVDENPEAAARFDVPRFMSGFFVHHAPGFEEWVASTRQSLLARYQQLLQKVIRSAMARSQWREAASWAARLLDADPLSEEACHDLIESLYMSGDAEAALAQYNTIRARLEREVNRTPGAALAQLVGRIQAEAASRGDRAQAAQQVPQTPSFEASLVGRESHWRALTEVWRDVQGGAGRVVLVEGDVGLGKTRLAEEFLRWTHAEGATVLAGRGYDPRTGTPFGPMVEALRDALDAPGLAGTAPEWLTELTRLMPELRRRFPGLSEPTAPSDAGERWRLFEAVAQALQALAAERPTVLVIDDLQWCDAETCALLHFLARHLETERVALIATVRLGELERDTPAARLRRSLRARGHAGVVELTPLSQHEVWLLIRQLGRISSPTGGQRFARRIHEVTDGNPFHVIELLKTLFSLGLLTVDGATGDWKATRTDEGERSELLPMPPTVREAISERVARLPIELRDLLATVGVGGSGCRPALLSHVHGISRLRAAAQCDELVDRLLLVEEGGVYRPAHPVIAEVVRDGLTAPRRREVHRAIALSLEAITTPAEAGEVAGQVARHADKGGERAMACRHAMLASEEAVRRYAFDEALSWLDLAAGAAAPGEETDAVNRRTADVMGLAGWTDPPGRPGRHRTPAGGIARTDLDLGQT